MCDCIKKIGEEIREKYGNGYVDPVCTNYNGRIYVRGLFNKMTKKGRLSKHNSYISLQHKVKFCPFCGKPYDDNNK